MKRFRLTFFFATAAVLAAAAEPGAPDLVLRINGHASASTPLKLARGEPVIAEVVLRPASFGAPQPIRLEPPAGSWSSRVKIVSAVAGNAPSASWPFVIAGKPSSGALALQPGAVTTLVVRLDALAAAALPPGVYPLTARLDLADGRGWRGVVESEAIEVEVTAAVETPTAESLGRQQLFRVRDALLVADVPRAEAAAEEMVRADPQRPEGWMALALVSEAKGERRPALVFMNLAIARVAGVALTKAVPGVAEPALKPVPLEYYELQQRIETMSSNEPEPEPIPGYPENVVAPRVNATPAPQPAAGSMPKPASLKPSAPAAITSVGNASVAPVADDAKFSSDPRGQWASGGEASSEHGRPNYSAVQATGAPNVTTYADHPETWVSASADRGEEWLKLTFANPVRASAVRVRQVLGPGTIVKIEVFAADGHSAVVWSGRDRGVYAKNQISWFIATFPPTDFPVQTVKLTLDTSLVLGWNSIDAVQLVGEL